MVEWWARSAELAREGGFDGTEVHISHSYLLHQFLSPLYNKRTDEYGGSFENRLRFSREVIAAVRERVGTDWVVGVRISLTDFIPGALDVEDAIRVAQTLEADGQIDYVNVTAAGYHNIHLAIEPSDVPDGYLVDLAAQVKAAVCGLPVFTVGGIKDPALAEEILAAGQGGHGRDDARADRRPGVREQGAGGPRGRGRPLHPRATRAASAACSRGCRSLARSTRRPGARGGCGRWPRPSAGALGRGRRWAGGDEGGGDAREARARR